MPSPRHLVGLSLLALGLLCLPASARFETDITSRTLDRIADNQFGTDKSLSEHADQLGTLLEQRTTRETQKGLLLLKDGLLDNAKRLLTKSLEANPKQVDAWLGLLFVELKRNNLIPAQRVSTQALQHFPQHPEVRAYIALLAAASGHEGKAIAFLEDTLAEQPDALMPALHLANLYVQTKQAPRAVPIFEHLITKHPRDPGLYRALALLYIKIDRLPDAESTLRRALVRCKETTGSKLLLGRVILRLNRPGEAASWLEQIPEDHPYERLSVLYLSEAYTADNDIPAAVRLLESWLERFAKDTLLRYRLAVLLQATNKPTQAIDQLRTLVKHSPDYVAALNDLASLLCEEPTSLPEAATWSSMALTLAPRDPAILDTAGWVAWHQGDHQTAQSHLDTALTALPNHPHIQLHLAVVLATTPGASAADRQRARTLAQKAVQQQPSWAKHPRLIQAGLVTP